MLRSTRARTTGDRCGASFFLYVEGPRDRDILSAWARRISSDLTRAVDTAVILGGRQPARALDHFRSEGGGAAGHRGVCVLDRDGGAEPTGDLEEPGLELFTWPRRHIESYLLVPGAIGRCARLSPSDARLARLLREHVPDVDDELLLRDLDAKRLLETRGPIPRALGRSVSPGRIARSMRAAELHEDVLALFERLREVLGLREPERAVVRRKNPA